jgi:aminoglycoside phosphotransferase (APT) family kinase protein
MQEGEVRAALAAFDLMRAAQGNRLLHGDFWPGNLLWRDGELVAVIDWEDASLGNPLEDVAIARLDLLWFFGEEAMHHFSEAYRTQMGDEMGEELDFESLPYWDLLAALRPTGHIDEWAAGLAGLGRADMTASFMRAAHRRFVNQALAALGR